MDGALFFASGMEIVTSRFAFALGAGAGAGAGAGGGGDGAFLGAAGGGGGGGGDGAFLGAGAGGGDGAFLGGGGGDDLTFFNNLRPEEEASSVFSVSIALATILSYWSSSS
jgi:hypothetical protein